MTLGRLFVFSSQSWLPLVVANRRAVVERRRADDESTVGPVRNYDYAMKLSPEIRDAFKQHLVKELAVDNLAFLVTTEEFQRSARDATLATRRAHSLNLIEVYVRGDSLIPINISMSMSNAILADSCSKDVSPTLCDDAVREIASPLAKGPWKRFIRTSQFEALETLYGNGA